MTIIITQGWRFFSELLRADYRGGDKISIYQIFAVLSIIYVSAVVLIFKSPVPAPLANLESGLRFIWDPALILVFQVFWVLIFIRTGKSSVTGSNLSFFVHRSRV